MAIPKITPLPPAPSRQDAPDDFTSKADAFVAAQVKLVTETNASIDGMNSATADLSGSVSAASASAQTATNAAVAAKHSQDAAKASADSAQLAAAAAGDATGLTGLSGKAGLPVVINQQENGITVGAFPALQQVGDTLYSTQAPDANWKAADGSVLTQASYPDLFSKIGLLADGQGSWTQYAAWGSSSFVTVGAAEDGNNIYLVASSSGVQLTKSTDLNTWSGSVPSTAYSPSAVACNPADGTIVIVGNAGNISYSRDGGKTFNTSVVLSGKLFTSVKFLKGMFVAVTSDAYIAYSQNGVSWSSRSMQVSGTVNDIAYDATLDRFVMVGGTSSTAAICVWYSNSSDISTLTISSWSLVTISGAPTGYLRSVISDGGGNFVAVGDKGAIVKSVSGLAQFVVSAGSPQGTATLNAVRYARGLFIACGNSGKLITSKDRDAWMSHTPPGLTSQNLNAITFFKGTFIIGGYSGYAAGSTLLLFDPATEFALPSLPQLTGMIGPIKPFIKAK